MNGWPPDEVARIDEINRMEWRAAGEPTRLRLLALCAEAEYWVVRTENDPSGNDDP